MKAKACNEPGRATIIEVNYRNGVPCQCEKIRGKKKATKHKGAKHIREKNVRDYLGSSLYIVVKRRSSR